MIPIQYSIFDCSINPLVVDITEKRFTVSFLTGKILQELKSSFQRIQTSFLVRYSVIGELSLSALIVAISR